MGGNYTFDFNGMSPDARAQAVTQARNTVHMADNAGQEAAAYCLRARDIIDDQLNGIQDLKQVQGYGDLPTGHKAQDDYAIAADKLKDALTALRDEHQAMADRFIATEMALRTVESQNTKNFKDLYPDGTVTVPY